MNNLERVELLKERHRKIDEILSSEAVGPAVDEARVAELKKSKLRIKDEMTILKMQKV